MLSDKEQKKVFRKIASADPDKYFPTKELRNKGFIRKLCKCGTYFWTTHEDREVCGSPICSGGFQVVENNPSKIQLSFIGVWKKIVEILEPRGYKPINRYPCVARWNPTTEFTIASISAFQPYVITGEVEPPAKKLIIPQFCLRFSDIENVGITGSHCTGFVMIGQHAFVKPEEWKQGEYFLDIYDFITEGIGVSKHELTIHEDSWAGGGSYGCSLEFFSRGVELFNQVYTMFEQTPEGSRELPLKVLDMGLGQERVAWFSQGTPNMYEATFPYVLSKLRKKTKIDLDLKLYNKFSQYSAFLNIDEVDDLKKAWERVAKKLNVDVSELEKKIIPMTALYSIAEHARTLLFAINDGKLPSNVGGGYNLRVIFRRAISFIDKFKWDIDLANVCTWHAKELKGIFPELLDHLDEIKKILDVELKKFKTTKHRANKILERTLIYKKISTETLIELYDSKGISPDMVKEVAKNYNVNVKIPENFYTLVVERHNRKEQNHTNKKEIELDLKGIPETELLYYENYEKISNQARVLKIIDKMIILDKSVAYPTSGGQLHDVGEINSQKFSEIFNQGNHVIHVLDEKPKFREGDEVEIKLDKERRYQLSQHHTATHIVNAAARDVLGSHVNQAGARKTLKYSHLDITHYEKIPRILLDEIEYRANNIVEKNLKINLCFMPRTEAEQKYGMNIYQGGAVPGKLIRIVEIPEIDVEACGGTHLNFTGETRDIRIIKSQKIQDSVVRLTFTAGKATDEILNSHELIFYELKDLLKVETHQVYTAVRKLYDKSRNLKKALRMGKVDPNNLILGLRRTRDTNYYDIKKKSEILVRISNYLKVKEEKLPFKIEKMLHEWEENKQKLEKIKNLYSEDKINSYITDAWPVHEYKFVSDSFEGISQNDAKNLSLKIFEKSPETITNFTIKQDNGIAVTGLSGTTVSIDPEIDLREIYNPVVVERDGKGGGKKNYYTGFIPDPDTDLKQFRQDIFNKIKKSKKHPDERI